MNFNLPRDLDRPEVRVFHAPRLVDCRWKTCPARRGEHCLTPAGAFAPYHQPRQADVADLTDEQRVTGFAALRAELRERRTERDAAMRQPLSAEERATRAATRAAWDAMGRDVVRAEREGTQ